MTNFNDTSYELISAYLDGELTVEERARVEALLASSVEHRRMHEDLQLLRGRFEELPKHRAPERLSLRIMDAIADKPLPVQEAATATTTPHVSPQTPHAQRHWVAGLVRLAIAASLLVAAWAVYRSFNPAMPNRDLVISPDESGNSPDRVGPDHVPPEIDPPGLPETGFVFQEVASDLLLIFDFVVEPRLLENDTFKNTLKMHDIEVNDTIVPDLATQKTILESAAFGVADATEEANRKGQVQFSIVVADIDKLFLISQSLNGVQGVKSMRTDLSVNPADMQMMRALERSRRSQFANTASTGAGRAYFVALRDDLQDVLLGPAGAVTKLNGLGGAANLGQAAPGGEAQVMPVAFILRAAAK